MGAALARRVALVCGLMLCNSGVCKSQSAGSVASPVLSAAGASAPMAPNRIGIGPDSLPATHPPITDTFVGSDKVKHFLISGFVEAVGFSAMQFAGAGRTTSLAAATAVGAAAGVGRELHDRRTKGLFSLGDLAWDGLGIGAALFLISQTQR